VRKFTTYLVHTDGRIDRYECDETITLRDIDDGRKARPFVAVSHLAAVDLIGGDPDVIATTPTIAALTRMFGDQLALSYLDGFTAGERFSSVVTEEDQARLVADLRTYAKKLVRQTIAELGESA
jgi:hypothetical protein